MMRRAWCVVIAWVSATVGSATTPDFVHDSSAAESRRLSSDTEELHVPCPVHAPYSAVPTPFGWPLSPANWSFSRQDCWQEAHLICGGLRQSPMDIKLTSGGTGCSETPAAGNDGIFADHYTFFPGQPIKVQVSPYMGTVMAADRFGELRVPRGSEEVIFDAVQIHVTAPSLHTIDGQHFDAEVMVFHQRRGAKDMLEEAVAVSFFLTEALPGQEGSKILEAMGFPVNGEVAGQPKRRLERPWDTEGLINLKEEMTAALRGTAYVYDGSVPVPPCSENVKWIILGSQPQPVSPKQTEELRALLLAVRGGARQHRVARNESDRCVAVNSVQIGGTHSHHTCEADYHAGTWMESASCWEVKDRCWAKRYSAVNIETADAVQATEGSIQNVRDLIHYKTVDSFLVSGSLYTVDAFLEKHGDFGHLLLNGHVYFATNITFKAVSQHVIDSNRAEGELVIEHVLYGDWMPDAKSSWKDGLHKVMVSIPLKLGAENQLLRKLHLGDSTSRVIRDGQQYHAKEEINLAEELDPVLGGRWFWYSSNATHRNCGTSVRWMVFERALEVSLEQLNWLTVPVSGVDSSHMPYKVPPGSYWQEHLPASAVEANETECDDLAPWDYGNERCWSQCSGMRQSPINIAAESVVAVGKLLENNFLSKCSWKPVTNLRVVNTGYNMQVKNTQLGYITLINQKGFPDYYQVAEFNIHMPSEHMVNGKQYAAELQIVHKRQKTVLDLIDDDLVITSIMFDFGEESKVLNQLFLPNGSSDLKETGTFKTMTKPFDPMWAFGPVIDGPYYRYDGSLTTPPCSEVVKWFVFETPMFLSIEQWSAFKHLYPNPGNNRPVQPVNGRMVAKNSLQQGQEVDYRFFLNREMGRNRMEKTPPAMIFVPICGTLLLMSLIMTATFVRSTNGRKRESAGGLTDAS